jgi:hypothetical protein
VLQEIDTQAEDMRRERGVPSWVVGYVGWAQRLSANTAKEAAKRHAALVAKRGLYIAALQLLEKELQEQPPLVTPDETTADWVAMAGYEWVTKVCVWWGGGVGLWCEGGWRPGPSGRGWIIVVAPAVRLYPIVSIQ